jgi:hypothetical protein
MTSTSADRVTLILDCLGHEDTDLTGQPRLWRHRDGRYVTEDEAETIKKTTLREIRYAMDLWHEEVVALGDRAELSAEFDGLMRPYDADDPTEFVGNVISRMPEADAKRAAEIWERIGPHYEMWRRDQP